MIIHLSFLTVKMSSRTDKWLTSWSRNVSNMIIPYSPDLGKVSMLTNIPWLLQIYFATHPPHSVLLTFLLSIYFPLLSPCPFLFTVSPLSYFSQFRIPLHLSSFPFIFPHFNFLFILPSCPFLPRLLCLFSSIPRPSFSLLLPQKNPSEPCDVETPTCRRVT